MEGKPDAYYHPLSYTQPIMAEIKEKYPNPEIQNAMVAKLYEDTDSNPLAGCLPSLFQIPVFIAVSVDFLPDD